MAKDRAKANIRVNSPVEEEGLQEVVKLIQVSYLYKNYFIQIFIIKLLIKSNFSLNKNKGAAPAGAPPQQGGAAPQYPGAGGGAGQAAYPGGTRRFAAYSKLAHASALRRRHL
jgi:hypothetical protein